VGAVQVQFGLLGPLEVRDGARLVAVPRARVRALLALLLLHPRRAVTADWIAGQLWGDRPPARPVGAVQNYVSILRHLLPVADEQPPLLVTEPGGYVLQVPDEDIDVALFEQLAGVAGEAMRARRWGEAAEVTGRALALWRGPALAEFRYHEFATAPAARLEELRRAVEEDRIRARLALGEHAHLIGELEAAVSAEPLREPLWGHLMLCLYRAGRQADALDAYRKLGHLLDEDLGLAPGPELQRLQAAILRQSPALDWNPPAEGHGGVAGPAGRPAASERIAAPKSLPRFTTGFVGRRQELEAVRDLLVRTDARLVTLTGPGGSGKTRLAVETAAGLSGDFPGGVWFVPLAAVREAGLVGPAIAQALGVEDTTDRPWLDAITDHLRDRRALLVLDNFEQVRAAAGLVADLLVAAPQTTVMTTSRVVLGVDGEHECRVLPLPLPSAHHADLEALAGSEAVALFLQRAQAVVPSFVLKPENAEAIAEICARVDGLPLAIELAAARVRMLTPQELLRLLDRRLELLSGGAPELPDRHRTLRQTIEWSHDLLDANTRALFRRLSVFTGGCTIDAAEAVIGGGVGHFLDGVASLLDNSLLWADQSTGESRYRMLETIREYARERLDVSGEADEYHRRHALYHVALAERACEQLFGRMEQVGLADLDRAHDDITAALAWALSSDRREEELALKLVASMGLYWYTAGRTRLGAMWLERALEYGAQARPALRIIPCFWLGGILDRLGDRRRGRGFMEESVALARATDHRQRLAGALNGLATVLEHEGAFARARQTYEESLELFRDQQDDAGVGMVLNGLGSLALEEGDTERAAATLEESIEYFRRVEDPWSIGIARCFLARVMLEQERPQASRDLLALAVPALRERDELTYLAECLECYACLAVLDGVPARAGRLVGAAGTLRRSISVPATGRWRATIERHVVLARGRHAVQYEAACQQGAQLSLDQALDYAFSSV
jgi:predicted ATPase/DNA-binding SARP family transcriptional activator